MQNLIPPLENLLGRLTESWGPQGTPGDASEIHHVCLLLRDAVEQVVAHEERLWFVKVGEDFEPLVDLLKDCVGSQVLKFESIPGTLDKAIALIGTDHGGTKEQPTIIHKTVTFELPDYWADQFRRELRRAERKLAGKSDTGGFWSGFIAGPLHRPR